MDDIIKSLLMKLIWLQVANTGVATVMIIIVKILHDTRCIVPERDGVFSGQEFRTDLWDKYSTAAPAQQRQYGALSNVVSKAYKR